MMLVRYVINSKVSRVNSFAITNFLVYMSNIYGGLTVQKGKVHDYFGMGLD